MSYNRNTIKTITCARCNETFYSTVFVENPRLITTHNILDEKLLGEAVGTIVCVCPFCGSTNRFNMIVPIDPAEIILRRFNDD